MTEHPPTLIGISGRAGAGKDSVARILRDRFGVHAIALADPMKRFTAEVFGFSQEQLWGPSSSRNAPDARWDGLTPRRALQTLGSEWGRALHPDVWVRYALSVARAKNANGYHVAITDVRFPNEAAAVRAAGGLMWRVTRPSASPGLDAMASSHVSETSLGDGDAYDAIVANDGTLLDLWRRVVAMGVGAGLGGEP